MKYYATRKTVQYGNSTYVVLDKDWGIRPGDMVQIEVERVDTRAGPEKAD